MTVTRMPTLICKLHSIGDLEVNPSIILVLTTVQSSFFYGELKWNGCHVDNMQQVGHGICCMIFEFEEFYE